MMMIINFGPLILTRFTGRVSRAKNVYQIKNITTTDDLFCFEIL
jgi:hypothetical protein